MRADIPKKSVPRTKKKSGWGRDRERMSIVPGRERVHACELGRVLLTITPALVGIGESSRPA